MNINFLIWNEWKFLRHLCTSIYKYSRHTMHTCVYMHTHVHLCVCAHIYIYIYIYIIYIYTNFIKHNRHFVSTYFLLDPFVFSYCFYRIRQELIYVLSIVVCIPSTFYPTLGHHQGRIYYKRSDVTFVFAYYYYVRASLPLRIIVFSFKWVSINSVSS